MSTEHAADCYGRRVRLGAYAVERRGVCVSVCVFVCVGCNGYMCPQNRVRLGVCAAERRGFMSVFVSVWYVYMYYQAFPFLRRFFFVFF